MIVGLGIDLVELDRVAHMLDRWRGRLLTKIMSSAEMERLPAAGTERVLAVATAIALKEAASKALGTGWSRGVRWKDVLAFTTPAGRVELVNQAAQVGAQLGADGPATVVVEAHGNLIVAEVRLVSTSRVGPDAGRKPAGLG